MNKLNILLISVIIFLASCASTKNTEKITIASEKGDCVGVAPMKCYLIKKEGQSNWEFLYTGIEGFNYEPGFEYVLEIKKDTIIGSNPVADRSSIKYTLVKEISKTLKDSTGLPTQ